MRAGDILRKTIEIVEGSRQTTHGDKEGSFIEIATMWNVYLRARKGDDRRITAGDVAHMMVLMKMVRAVQGDLSADDHYIDMAGYAAIAGEINTPESATEPPYNGGISCANI